MTAPLVFLPGWCLGRGPLNAAVNALNGTIFDLPGYGAAPLISDFYNAADDIAARLQPDTTLCGWSLGAQLALAIATRAPEKVGKLVLVAGTVSFIQRDGWPHAMPPEMLAEFTAGILADVEAMLPRFVGGFNRGDARAKEVSRQLLELADPRPPLATLATGLDWLRDVDLRRLAPQIKSADLAHPRFGRPADAARRRRSTGCVDSPSPTRHLCRLRPRPVHFPPGRFPRTDKRFPE